MRGLISQFLLSFIELPFFKNLTVGYGANFLKNQ